MVLILSDINVYRVDLYVYRVDLYVYRVDLYISPINEISDFFHAVCVTWHETFLMKVKDFEWRN